jgi:hypothetical protein
MVSLRWLLGAVSVVMGTVFCAEEALLAVPDADKQKAIEKTLKEVYGTEYAKGKPEDKAELAKKLMQQAEETNDDFATKYVLWREASLVAAQAGDMDTSMALLDKIAKTYAADLAPLRKTALATLGAVTQDGELARAVGAMKTMLEKPDDPMANLILGRYLCFVKGDWDKGMPYLGKNAYPVFKALVEKEGARPTDAMEQMSLADEWWAVADREDNKAQKAGLQNRAVFWYEKALPSLTSLNKAKAEKRIAMAKGSDFASAGQSGINLLTLIDPKMDTVNGNWVRNGSTLQSDGTKNARIEIPYQPPDEYDFRVVFTRLSGNECVAQMISHAGHMTCWENGASRNTKFTFSADPGLLAKTLPPSTTVAQCVQNNHKHTCLIKVRKSGIEAYFDGRSVGKWQTDYTDVGAFKDWKLRDNTVLGLGSYESPTVFHLAEIIEVTGHGKRLR